MTQTFGKKKLVKDISANTLQTAITQVFALVIFYITSKYLAKDDFGEFNWSMAIGSTIIALTSLGLDVVFVKRVASGQDALVISGIHFFHTVMAGIVLCSGILLGRALFPGFSALHPLFLLVFINLSLINISNSFRLCLMGLESYRYLAIIAVCTNVLRFVLIMVLYLQGYFTISNVITAFILSSVLELLLGYYFAGRSMKARLKPVLKVKDYRYFILESLPQLGVVFFDSALARIDWILLGILSTASITAEYSFVYRMYESSKLPLLIIAPILLTRFSKLFAEPERIDEKNRTDIQLFFKLELFIVMLIPVVLCCVWTPVIDFFTNNKYGEVNEVNYLILAGCVPLHCICNFLWSMGFAQGQLKAIMYITIAVAVLNFGINFFIIPLYGSLGASIAFLFSTIFQTALYIKYMRQNHIGLDLKICFIAFVNAAAAIAGARFLTNNVIFATATALIIITGLGLLTGQLSIKQIKQLVRRS